MSEPAPAKIIGLGASGEGILLIIPVDFLLKVLMDIIDFLELLCYDKL